MASACFEQGVPWHSGNYRVWIHPKIAYVTWQEHTVKCTVQMSTQSRAQSFWPVWPNGWVFVYELSGSGFESSCIHVRLWLKCYPQNFSGAGSIYESNIFMLKSQTWWWIFTLKHAWGFNKTGYGLTDIAIAWDEFKAVLYPEFFGGIRIIISTVC